MRLFFSLLLLLTVDITAAQDTAPEAMTEFTDHPARVVTNINALRVRSSPAIEAENIVGQLRPGQRVQVLARAGDWQQVRREDGLVGWSHSDYLIDLPARQLGETRAFRIRDHLRDTSVLVNAELRHIGAHNYIYVNARNDEDAKTISTGHLQLVGNLFDDRIYSQALALWGEGNVPSYEGDERVVILFLHGYDVPGIGGGWYSGREAMPGEVNPYGDRVGFLAIKWNPLAHDVRYQTKDLAHEFLHMIQHMVGFDQMEWVIEGLAEFASKYVLGEGYSKFINDPRIPLQVDIQPDLVGTKVYDVWRLFMDYIHERFGLETVQHFARHPEDGLAALDAVFAERGIEMDADTFFADWVLANYLQDSQLEDGRYGYEILDGGAARTSPAFGNVTQLPAQIQESNYSYATDYYGLSLPAAEQTRQIILNLQLAAPSSQDVWLQLVQVVDGRVILQRFHASDFHGQAIPVSLETGANYAFLAISPFAPSQPDKAEPTDYALVIQTQAEPLSTIWNTAHAGDPAGVRRQVARGVNPNLTDEHGNTALMRAAFWGYEEIVQYLLNAGANLHLQNNSGRTALHEAAFWGHAGVVQRLLAAGANLHQADKSGRTAVDEALDWGHSLTLLQFYLYGAELDLAEQIGPSVLVEAARAGHADIFSLVFTADMDVSWRDEEGRTALHEAAFWGYNEPISQLLEAGADVNARDAYGQTPFMLAATNGQVESLVLLLATGADANLQDTAGRTALSMAAMNGQAFTVAWLLRASDVDVQLTERGSGRNALHLAAAAGHDEVVALLTLTDLDPNAPDTNGQTAQVLAAAAGHAEVLELLRIASLPPGLREDIERPRRDTQKTTTAFFRAAWAGDLPELERLFNLITIVDIQNHQLRTVLHLAAESGHRNSVLRLLHAGASPNARDGINNWIPLFFAIENGHTEIATLLFAAGSHLYYFDYSVRTALHFACWSQNVEIVRVLLTQQGRWDGINVNAQDTIGRTPLMHAALFGNLEIVDMLLNAGADPNLLTEQGISAIGYAAIDGHTAIIQRLRAAGAN